MSKQSAIYILDGMGPQAGGYLYNMLINKATEQYGAKNNDDFPEIILHSIPVPDFISSDRKRSDALTMLKNRVTDGEKLNVSCFSIACNTAHILLKQLQEVSKLPFVSIVNEVVSSVTQSKFKIVGVIGTPSALRHEIYQTALKERGIESVIPTKSQISILGKIIRNILRGDKNKDDQERLISIADSLKKKGAQAIILGCTELPLIFPFGYPLPVYNSVEILAQSLLQISFKRKTQGGEYYVRKIKTRRTNEV